MIDLPMHPNGDQPPGRGPAELAFDCRHFLGDRPCRPQPEHESPDRNVEHRGQEQPEEGHADHAGEHRSAERLAHLGARPRRDH